MLCCALPCRAGVGSPIGLGNVRPHSCTLSDSGSGRVSLGNSPNLAASMPTLCAVSASSVLMSGPVALASWNLVLTSRN